MSRHVFERKQFIPIPLEKAWAFFSDPRNLSRITPPALDFRIVSKVPEQVVDGLTIEYRVRPMLGIPTKWVSLIKDIKAPYQFVDVQVKGPYRYWHHLHRFNEALGGVMMEDIIHYEAPMEWLFPWINGAIVVRQLNGIFDYRSKTLKQLF